jgi:hypothetical protein
MANWDKARLIEDWMTADPVLYRENLDLPFSIRPPTSQDLLTIFPKQKHSLQTWNRTAGVLIDDPHWIGICGASPMHTDFKYPRYTHHLLLKCDELGLAGISGNVAVLKRGSFIVLDTHSPHQVVNCNKLAIDLGWGPRKLKVQYYFAASLDADEVLNIDETKQRLIDYAQSTGVLDGYGNQA